MMMGGRERKRGLRIRVVAALVLPQSTIHLAFEFQTSPTRPTTAGQNEIATAISQLPPGGENRKVSRRGWCWSQRCDRSFVRPGLLGGGTSSWVQSRSSRRHPARCDVHKSRGERRESGGSGGKTTTHSNQPRLKHLPFPPFFFPDNVGDRYLAVTAMMHVSQPIANEWPMKPPFGNRQVGPHHKPASTYQGRDLRSV